MDHNTRKKSKKMTLAMLIAALALTTFAPCAYATGEVTEAAAEAAAEGQEAAEPIEEKEGINGYDVVYVIDNSKSVWKQASERNKAFKTITEEAAGNDVRIGAVYFADHIYKSLELTSVESDTGYTMVNEFLNMKENDDKNIDTNIGAALETAVAMLQNSEENRERIVILFSDGINENAAGDPEYKKAADANTEAQVKILQENDIPIYCVYLQKSRNDEDYLKNLVNYFDDSNSYAKERFAKVSSDKIDKLSKTFSDVFVIAQKEIVVRQEESSAAAETETEEETTEEATEEATEAGSGAAESSAAAASGAAEATAATEAAEESIPEVPEGAEDDGLPIGLIIGGILVAIALIGALIAIVIGTRKGAKKAKQSMAQAKKNSADASLDKSEMDYGALKMKYEWTFADYDDACDKLELYKNELKKLIRRGRTDEETAAALVAKAEELKVLGQPVIEKQQALVAQAADLVRDENAKKAHAKELRDLCTTLDAGTEELKTMNTDFIAEIKSIEETILKLGR